MGIMILGLLPSFFLNHKRNLFSSHFIHLIVSLVTVVVCLLLYCDRHCICSFNVYLYLWKELKWWHESFFYCTYLNISNASNKISHSDWKMYSFNLARMFLKSDKDFSCTYVTSIFSMHQLYCKVAFNLSNIT